MTKRTQLHMPLEIHPLMKNSNDFHAIFYENVKKSSVCISSLRPKFPNNPDSKRQRSQESAEVGDGLGGFKTCDSPKPRHDKDGRQEIQTLATHGKQGGLPGVADVLEQHIGSSAKPH